MLAEFSLRQQAEEMRAILHRNADREAESSQERFVVVDPQENQVELPAFSVTSDTDGTYYQGSLPSFIAEALDREERQKYEARTRRPTTDAHIFFADLLDVYYHPQRRLLAMTDGLRWDGEEYAFMKIDAVFRSMNLGLSFINGDDRVQLIALPLQSGVAKNPF